MDDLILKYLTQGVDNNWANGHLDNIFGGLHENRVLEKSISFLFNFHNEEGAKSYCGSIILVNSAFINRYF